MIKFALLGTGRIGKLHAKIISSHPDAHISLVYDINLQASKKLQKNIIVKLQILLTKQLIILELMQY